MLGFLAWSSVEPIDPVKLEFGLATVQGAGGE